MTADRRWELVQSSDAEVTYRIEVPGGWLYRVEIRGPDGYGIVNQMVTFVPRPAARAKGPKA